MKSNIYNVGLSEANLTKLQLCEEIKELLPEFEIFIDKRVKIQTKEITLFQMKN